MHIMTEPPLEKAASQPMQASVGTLPLSSLGSFAGLPSNCLVIESLQWEEQMAAAHSPSTAIPLRQREDCRESRRRA